MARATPLPIPDSDDEVDAVDYAETLRQAQGSWDDWTPEDVAQELAPWPASMTFEDREVVSGIRSSIAARMYPKGRS